MTLRDWWWKFAKSKELGLVLSNKARDAYEAGIPPARIAEMLNCTETQVLMAVEEYHRIRASIDEWKATIEAEKARR